MKTDLKITTAIASVLLASACSQQNDNGWGETADRNTAICTDRSGKRVPEANCQRQGAYGGGGSGSNAFLWYYLGRSSMVPYYGDSVRGGSYQRAAGANYFRAPAASSMARSAAISRGGFGSSAEGFGGGHSGAGE